MAAASSLVLLSPIASPRFSPLADVAASVSAAAADEVVGAGYTGELIVARDLQTVTF